MIRRSIWCVCLLFPLLLSAQRAGHKIDIEVTGLEADEAYLAYYYGDKQYIEDTTVVTNGKFSFAGEEALKPGFYLVVMPPDNNYFEIIVDTDQHFSLKTDQADLVKNMVVKGSEDNAVFYEDLLFLAAKRTEAEALQAQIKSTGASSADGQKAQAQLSEINGAVQAYRAELMATYPEFLYTKVLQALEEPQVPEAPKGPDGQVLDSLFAFKYYRSHYFDKVDLADARLLRSPVLYQKVDRYIEKLTYRHPDSIAASIDLILQKAQPDDDVFQFFCVNFLNKYAKNKIMGMDAVYVHLVENYYMSGKAWWTDSAMVAQMTERALALSPTLLGRLSPNFRVQDASENWHQLHGVDADYTILYFWDYDCGHCKKITPQLAEAFKAYADHPVKLFAVSINGAIDKWQERSAEYGLMGPGVINCQDHYRRSGFDGLYDVRSTPRIFLLDADKKIMAKQISVAQLQEILDRNLGIETEASEVKDTGDKAPKGK